MKLSRRVKLGNAQLDEAAKPIAIRTVEIREAAESFSTVNLEGVDGQRVTGHRRDTLDVSVKFGIDIGKRNLEELNRHAEKNKNGTGGGLGGKGQEGKRRSLDDGELETEKTAAGVPGNAAGGGRPVGLDEGLRDRFPGVSCAVLAG